MHSSSDPTSKSDTLPSHFLNSGKSCLARFYLVPSTVSSDFDNAACSHIRAALIDPNLTRSERSLG